MPDSSASIPFEAVKIERYEEVGKIILRWMKEGLPAGLKREGPIEDLIEALGGKDEVKLPSTFETYKIFDGSDTVFQFRMPPPELTEAGRKRACEELDPDEDTYDPPNFYKVKIGNHRAMSHCDFFFARVADYTMNMCK